MINAIFVVFSPRIYKKEITKEKIKYARTFSAEELEAAAWVEPMPSSWDQVRIGVRRGILYSKVFHTDLNTGIKISKLARCKVCDGQGCVQQGSVAKKS